MMHHHHHSLINNNNDKSNLELFRENDNIKNKGPDHWKSVLDNFFVEFLASLSIIVSTIMYGGFKSSANDVVFYDPCKSLFLLLL